MHCRLELKTDVVGRECIDVSGNRITDHRKVRPMIDLRGSKNAIATLLICFFGSAALAEVQVRDADTIIVSGQAIRLNGVDAPELGTRAGQDSRRWMVNFLRGKEVTCDLNGERTHDRLVGVCFAEGADVGAAVIAAGYALDCARYSGGRYSDLETPAAKSRLTRARYC